jgi:hypothetical protein
MLNISGIGARLKPAASSGECSLSGQPAESHNGIAIRFNPAKPDRSAAPGYIVSATTM